MNRRLLRFRPAITTQTSPVLAGGHVSIVVPTPRRFCTDCGTEVFAGTEHVHYEQASG